MITKREKAIVLQYIREGRNTISKMATAHFGDHKGDSWQREKDVNYFRRIVYHMRNIGQLRQIGRARDKRIVVWEAIE